MTFRFLPVRLLVSFGLVFPALSPVFALDASAPVITQFTLDNGLKVVLAPLATAKNVAVVVQYDVGSANETPGHSGFAHLFEHLMFEGTKSIPNFDEVASSVGAQNNAFTQDDGTVFHITGPRAGLPVMLRLDADRMANLANSVTQEDLDNQREVVLNEMRQNVLDAPGGAARSQGSVAIYPKGHPYDHATIGSIADLKAAKLEDVVAFHRQYYVPSNAYLAVAGDFDVAEAKADIDQTFGLIPKFAKPAFLDAVAPPAKAGRMGFVDAVPTQIIALTWPGVVGYGKDANRLTALASAMGVGKWSLGNKLVLESGIASSAGAYYDQKQYGGAFTIYAAGAQGVSADKLEASLNDAVATMQKDGVPQEALETYRTNLESNYDNLPSSPLDFAMTLGGAVSVTGDANTWRNEVEEAKSFTAGDLTKLLQSFTKDTAMIVTVTPGSRNTDYPPTLANSTGNSPTPQIAGRPEVVMPDLKAGAATATIFPTVETMKLANGATLISYYVNDTVNAALVLTEKGGAIDAPMGLASVAVDVGSRGAGDMPLIEFDQKLRDKNISLGGGASTYMSSISASAPLKNFDDMLNFLALSISHPRFDDKEWMSIIDGQKAALKAQKESPDYYASLSLGQATYPKDALEVRVLDEAAIDALTIDKAKALFNKRMDPKLATIYVASNMPIGDIAARMNKAFAEWTGVGAETQVFEKPSKPTIKDMTLTNQVAGTTQATIMAMLPAPHSGTVESAAFDIVVNVLGGTVNSRLSKVLREEKGWSYGIGAGKSGNKGLDNTIMTIGTTVEAAHTMDSIAEIRRIVSELASKPITDAEFQSALVSSKSRFQSAFDTAPGTAQLMGGLASSGFDLDDMKLFLANLEKVTLLDVNAQATILAKSQMALSYAGDKVTMK